jgi:hypothetical protein
MTKPVAHSVVFDWVPDGLPAVSQERRNGVRVTTAAAAALGLALSGGAGTEGTASDTSSNGFERTKAPGGRRTPPETVVSVEVVGSCRPGMILRSRPSKRSPSSSLTRWGPDRALPGGGAGLHKGDHPESLLSSR